MVDDDSVRSDWQPPDWLTARPRPLVSQSQPPGAALASTGAARAPDAARATVEGTREIPPVPDMPAASEASWVPLLPPPPADMDPRPTLRSRPADRERPDEACEIPVTRDVRRDRGRPPEPAPEPATPPTTPPVATEEPAQPEPSVQTEEPPVSEAAPTAAELADPDLAARLRAWQRVDQDLYRLLGYEGTERLVFRDEGGDLREAPGSDELARRLREAKFEVSRIEARAWRDVGLWGTAALVALLVTGLFGLLDWFSPFWTFVVVFLLSSFGRLRRRWRLRLDHVVKDHRLTYELVRKRL